MLYQLYDWQRAALEPWRALAQAANEFYGHPTSPFSCLPGSRNVAAAFDLMGRLTQRYERPAFGIDSVSVGGRRLAVREVFEVAKPFCRLLHFVKDGAPAQPKVVVFAPLSGHFATLLRDTVNSLLADHDVWITDWIDAKEVPLAAGPFHFDDYVDYVRDFLRFVGPEAHAISVCQPTVPVLAGVSLMASNGEQTPRSLTMMGGPIDTRSSPTAVNDFAQHRPMSWFESKVVQRVPMRYPGFMRRVYPGFLQFAGFVAMNPDRHFESHVQYYQHLILGDGESADAHRRFYDEYNAVMDLPAEYYLETVERVFHRHLLPRGQLKVRGEKVRPEAIRGSALFTVEGELDDISGPGQTKAAHGLCRSIPAKRKQHFEAPGVGHYGIFSGRKYRETIYPRIRDFIARHDSPIAVPGTKPARP
ncbi:MAG: polyhydroxyalkanoate depolymerase [Betaproteobacteria bacterium]|nr:polyhydroxyalkanoate depolymerase [Betaproteobacteria bacterium]